MYEGRQRHAASTGTRERHPAAEADAERRARWEDATWPEPDGAAWADTMLLLTSVPERARLLSEHGWTPADLERAWRDPLHAAPPFEDWTAAEHPRPLSDRVAGRADPVAEAVLVGELLRLYEALSEIAREYRLAYAELLARQGFSQARIAGLLGLSPARVQHLLKRSAPAPAPPAVTGRFPAHHPLLARPRADYHGRMPPATTPPRRRCPPRSPCSARPAEAA